MLPGRTAARARWTYDEGGIKVRAYRECSPGGLRRGHRLGRTDRSGAHDGVALTRVIEDATAGAQVLGRFGRVEGDLEDADAVRGHRCDKIERAGPWFDSAQDRDQPGRTDEIGDRRQA